MKLKTKYRQRMDVVICKLLHKFWSDYITEIGYLTQDRKRVVRSHAFETAVSLGQQVSNLKLCKDVNNTLANRQQILGTQLRARSSAAAKPGSADTKSQR